MKRDKYNKYNKNEIFFKNLASLYAEKSGNETKKEFAALDNSYHSSGPLPADKKIKSRVRAYKVKKWTSRLLPVAACLIIFMAYIAVSIRLPGFDFPDKGNPDSVLSEKLTYEFVSDKLPSGYVLRKVDYDNQKAVYYIISENDTEIILTVEEYGELTEGLEKRRLKDIYANFAITEDYCFLQYQKDNLLYTLTSPDNISDLIKISENLI
jgi:hypothetical protein